MGSDWERSGVHAKKAAGPSRAQLGHILQEFENSSPQITCPLRTRLENTIERAVLMADGEVIHGHHLPPTLQTAEATGTVVNTSLGGAVATFERSLIEDALKTTRGNRSKAARLLGTTERVINYKVKKYGIDPARLRA